MRQRHGQKSSPPSGESSPTTSDRSEPLGAAADRASEAPLRHEILAAEATAEDIQSAPSLRPTNFEQYIGQKALMDKLQVYVAAARQRGEALDHLLLHGPPGLGKTTLSRIVAHEMGVQLHMSSGPAVEHKGVLAGLLSALNARDVLFIDEIHRMPTIVEESLYSAMEDGHIDIRMGEGSAATTMSMKLAPFTLVGATTRTALLSAPLRDRFQIIEGLEFYADDELAAIVKRTAGILGLDADDGAVLEIGRRSRGTPRIAIRQTRRIRDFVQVSGAERIEHAHAHRFLGTLGVDEAGLDVVDRRLLTTIIESFEGGPVGIEALGASLGIPRDTLEDVHEPFLLQRGFLVRTPRGRMTTAKARGHLNLESAAASDA